MTDTIRRATLRDLDRADFKAELIGGRVVRLPMSGFKPASIAAAVYTALLAFSKRTTRGFAATDGLDYVVTELPSGRESFRPDASYHLGPPPADPMDMVHGSPTFAVEVRSKGDYGPAAERDMAAKRADYFEAGTVAVWDVDPLAEVVRLYVRADPDRPTEFARGGIAHAEPAVPGWTMKVEDVFG
jgi:Uma2 family endonuclease